MQTCSICYFELDVNANVYTTECSHQYHNECIRAWYCSNHASCKTCPICRTQLNSNIVSLTVNEKYVSDVEKFIALDGVLLTGSIIFIDVEASGWKDLLKNLLMLITTQNTTHGIFQFDRSKLILKYDDRSFKFGFLLKDVKFQHVPKSDKNTNLKIMLSDFRYEQFENLKYLSKIVSNIANDAHTNSFVKRKPSKDIDHDELVSENSMIIAKLLNCMGQLNLQNDHINILDYVEGQCSLALIPSIVRLGDKIFYDIHCTQFVLVSGLPKTDFKYSNKFGDIN